MHGFYTIVLLLHLPLQRYIVCLLPAQFLWATTVIHCKLIQLTCVGGSFHWLWEIIPACVLHQSGQSPPSAGCCLVQLSHCTNQFS